MSIAELRIHQVESLRVGKVTSEVEKVGNVYDNLIDDVPLQRYVEAIVHIRTELADVGDSVPAEVRVAAERLAGNRD